MPPSRAEVDRILDTNSAAEFESLRGLPGVCLEPTGWAAACQLVHEGSEESLGKLGRHPRDTVVYRNFRRQVGCLGTSSDDCSVAAQVLTGLPADPGEVCQHGGVCQAHHLGLRC